MRQTKSLIALKPMTYATRRLLPGDAFEASDRDARILLVAKRAKEGEARSVGKIPPPSAKVIAKAAAPAPATNAAPDSPAEPGPAGPDEAEPSDIAALRAEYEAKFDKRPFMGWDADTLRQKIDAEA